MLGVSDIPLINKQCDGCRIQEQERRRDFCILCRYPQTSLNPYQYHFFKKMYGQTIYWGANIMHGTIGTMSFYNNCLGSIRSIFVYILTWNASLSSGLDNCPYRLLWKAHTILDNRLTTSSIPSELTVSSTHRRSMLEMASLYSCLSANQTVAILIKSRERLMLSSHDLHAFSHQD